MRLIKADYEGLPEAGGPVSHTCARQMNFGDLTVIKDFTALPIGASYEDGMEAWRRAEAVCGLRHYGQPLQPGLLIEGTDGFARKWKARHGRSR